MQNFSRLEFLAVRRRHSRFTCSMSLKNCRKKTFDMLCISLILLWKLSDLLCFIRSNQRFRKRHHKIRVSEKFKAKFLENFSFCILNFKGSLTPKPTKNQPKVDEQDIANITKDTPPAPIRITLASVEEYNYLLQNGLDFYGATYFPTEAALPATASKIATKKGR